MARTSKALSNTILRKRVLLFNRYYKMTKFYDFLKDTAIKGAIVVAFFVTLLLALEYFFLDFNAMLDSLVTNYSSKVIFSFFLLSETILGLVPPEIFIAWASKFGNPWLYLFILASLSYLGGVIAYFIGNRPRSSPRLPVEMASTCMATLVPSFITAPLPNCFSIWASAVSSAAFLSPAGPVGSCLDELSFFAAISLYLLI